MSRLATRFAELRAARRAGLVIFVTAGDPHPDQTVDLMEAHGAAGNPLPLNVVDLEPSPNMGANGDAICQSGHGSSPHAMLTPPAETDSRRMMLRARVAGDNWTSA